MHSVQQKPVYPAWTCFECRTDHYMVHHYTDHELHLYQIEINIM